MSNYFRTDECFDVLSSLEQCSFGLKQVYQLDYLRAWKWVVISLHSALQGALVCHLSGTETVGALSKDSAKKRMKWNRDLGDKDPGFVAPANELFDRMIDPSKRCEQTHASEIPATNEQKESFVRLHDLRNEFSHFKTKSWSIEVTWMEDILEPILDLLCLIAADGWSFRHMPEEGREIRRAIESARSAMTSRPN